MALALVLGWLVALLAVAALALPLTAWAFPDWPDRGASMAPTAGFAVLTLSAYWVGHLTFGPHVLLVSIGVLVLAAALAVRAGVALPGRAALGPLAVFTGGFCLLLGLRAVDPAVTPAAGEQFLDFALIQAVRRAPALPPQDVWFAGEPLRYYYGGPLLSGLLSWLTDTPPRYAYNLLLPTLFGALASAAYGLTGAIAAARGTPHRVAGLLGAGFVALAGPLATPLRGLSSFLPRDVAAEYGRVLYAGIQVDYADAVDTARFLGSGQFRYWEARYVIPDTPNVFPFWTYVNGDLRPHMYAAPFLLLAVGLALAYYRTPTERRRRRRVLLVGTLPAVGGLLGVVNTFDLPVVVGLAWLAVLFGDADSGSLLPGSLRSAVPGRGLETDGGLAVGAITRWGRENRRLPGSPVREAGRVLGATAAAAVVAALAVLWAAPLLLVNAPVNRGVALLGPTSGLGGLLLVFGGFLVAVALWLAPLAIEAWSRRRLATLAVALVALLVLTTAVGYPAVGLFGPLIVGGWWLVRTGRIRSFALVLVVAGAGLALAPEFAYAVVWPFDPNAPRWNTVYKITLQVWTLWGVAAGVALAAVIARARPVLASGLPGVVRRPVPAAAGVLAVVLIVLVATFPAFAVASHVDDVTGPDGDVSLSLNATETAWGERPGELAAARWLGEETTGQPTLVSKPAGEAVYTWDGGANPVSTFSGVPTLAGWEHVAGYHGIEQFRTRVHDVDRIYTGDPVVVRELLRRHDVDYVVVGPAERAAYGDRDFAADVDGLAVVYENPTVTIYAVDQRSLASAVP